MNALSMNVRENAELHGAERVGGVGPTAHRERAEWSLGLRAHARYDNPYKESRVCLLSVGRAKEMFENLCSRQADHIKILCNAEYFDYSTGLMEPVY